jgi:sugar phosphate isomerase/epimerase
LNFQDAADLTAEAGLNGVDCPVRPDGEILPENATSELPRYAEVLRERKLSIPLLTTAITSTKTPHTEAILRTAKKVGVQFYRLGFIMREGDLQAQVRQVRAQLKDLAALNKEIGIGAVLQNHSPSGKSYLGGDLSELYDIINGFDPSQIGVAFDIGHALVVHGDDWRGWFNKLKPHLKVAYVKDVKRAGGWVPFGTGDIEKTGYFKLLKEAGYHAPVSMHIEFDWTEAGKSKTRAALLKALRESGQVLRAWLES